MQTVEIKVRARKVTKGTETYIFFSTKGKNEKWADVRFTKSVTTVPSSSGTIVCLAENVNIDNTDKEHPVIWVKAYESFMPYRDEMLSEFFDVKDN